MLSKQDALIYVMVLVSAADREMPTIELSVIGEIVRRLPVFDGYEDSKLPETSARCAALLAKGDGLERTLDKITASLPEALRETAYALAVEVAAADRKVGIDEMRILEIIRHRLGIERLIAAAIERGVRARYRPG